MPEINASFPLIENVGLSGANPLYLQGFIETNRKVVVDTKACEKCGAEFTRNKKYSQAQWDAARFCGKQCACWNKGLTKHDDPRLQSIAEQVAVSAKGRPAWNRGATKHTDPRMAVVARKVSEAQRGKTINENQRRGLKAGRSWCKGLTKEDHPGLAKRGRAVRRRLKGRKNPEHGERMRRFYEENPQKHPNAILAKKTRGKGRTHIERLVGELLVEIGVEARFNRRVGRKWVDFAVENQRAVIECDGEFWHRDQHKEAERDRYIEAHGWRILHLTGSEIVSDTAVCKQRIADFLGLGGV